MNTSKKVFYPAVTPEFIQDCIDCSVSIRFDRMPDNSWQRLTSDHPLSWIKNNLSKVISCSMEIKEHSLKDEIFRWDDTKHLEVSIELRDDNTTYLFSAEMALGNIDYFLAVYLQE